MVLFPAVAGENNSYPGFATRHLKKENFFCELITPVAKLKSLWEDFILASDFLVDSPVFIYN